MEFLEKLWNDEEGQGMVEYALIIALISVVVIAVFPALTDALKATFDKIKDKLTAANAL